MDQQDRVAAFVEDHELSAPPAYRLLDLASELGEVAKELTESTAYGSDPESATVAEDELGDTLFALLALCAELDIDADEALDTALAKYEGRLDETGTAASGE
ncbi:MazG-like family protein [Halomicroarcula sp. GCM10025709]|uniref:MazG-like family protein n=1 Tax=Haloarcula TaxID=2237 RepID=UPI0024C29210|nr:MazG-like family protein [Halomicroarcula sp. YJ-61-S]